MRSPRQLGRLIPVGVGLAVLGPASAHAADALILKSGERVTGTLEPGALTLRTPQGTYQVTAATAWRVSLDRGIGDAVDLRNGNRISGILDQARFTLRLPGGETVAAHRGAVDAVLLGAATAAGGSRLPDVVILANGDHVSGQLEERAFDLRLPTGIERLPRERLWRILLGAAGQDILQLANGDELAGIVEVARYAIRTPDGQRLVFAREEVQAIALAPPPTPRAAAPPPAAAAGPPPPAAPAAPPPGPVAAVPPPALPPAVRSALRDVYFEFDRWELTPEARRILEDLATAMNRFPAFRLTVEGHADERGTSEYNLALGARRAQAVRDYLVTLGVDAARIETISYGEERPVDPAHNEMAWALNRRAHFVGRAP